MQKYDTKAARPRHALLGRGAALRARAACLALLLAGTTAPQARAEAAALGAIAFTDGTAGGLGFRSAWVAAP